MATTGAKLALQLSREKPSFDQVYELHKRRVYSLCLRMLGNPTTAEDLTQDVFLQVYRKLETFRGESAFTTWLHRLTTNAVRMHLRKPSVLLEQLVADDELSVLREKHLSRNSRCATSESVVTLSRAIENLPPGYKSVLVGHDIDGYRHAELARRLGIGLGTSKSQLHKARRKLRRLLRKPLIDRHLEVKTVRRSSRVRLPESESIKVCIKNKDRHRSIPKSETKTKKLKSRRLPMLKASKRWIVTHPQKNNRRRM
jgi:RNA polymerase sigma-70 factor, ECF subfamily